MDEPIIIKGKLDNGTRYEIEITTNLVLMAKLTSVTGNTAFYRVIKEIYGDNIWNGGSYSYDKTIEKVYNKFIEFSYK